MLAPSAEKTSVNSKVISTIRDSAGSHFEPAMVQAFDSVVDEICKIKSDWDAKEQISIP